MPNNSIQSDPLNEREFELVNIVGAEISASQRELSRHMDLSLGMTNMLLRRLIAKGYIRIRQLNKKKVEYILTPKGFAEKMRKSIKYTLKTMHSIGLIKERIKIVISKLYAKGERHFVVVGKSDFALLIEMVFKEMGISDYKLTYVDEVPPQETKGALLICKELPKNGLKNTARGIDLIHELSKDNIIINSQLANGWKNVK